MLRHLTALVRNVPAVVTGPVLLAVAVLGMVFAILQLRADALQDARRDIANLAMILGEQTARAVHAVDLILRDIEDSITQMHTDCELMPITAAGLTESHPHDIQMTVEAPNYHRR